MDVVSYPLILLLMLLLFTSAFFSASETAYSSVNKIRIKKYAEENRRGGKRALAIIDNFDQSLSTILVGNNIVNIASATIAATIATDVFGESRGLIISTFTMTLLVLIFGEILPKSYAKEHAERYALFTSGILSLLIKLLAPVTWGFVQLKNWLSKLVKSKEQEPSVTEEELKVMIDISEEEGVIDQQEKELVHSALDFNDIVVREILTPRTDMVAIDVHDPVEEVKHIFLTERFSRIPVYEEHIDHVIGILSEREFLAKLIEGEPVNIRSLLRKPMFIVESLKISTLLPELQKNKTHMAIVIDEFGGTSGLVTMEDVLEEIVGEIWDEHDEKVYLIKKVDDQTLIVFADISLDDFCELVRVKVPETPYHSLGGWIVEQLERIPHVGEEVVYEHVILQVAEVEGHRLRKVKVMMTHDFAN